MFTKEQVTKKKKKRRANKTEAIREEKIEPDIMQESYQKRDIIATCTNTHTHTHTHTRIYIYTII